MKFDKHFRAFLISHVNLNQTRLDQLDGHVEAIENYLRSHETWSDMILEIIPQGSWAHETIIKPLPNKEFDADFLLEIQLQQDWEPKAYINKLKAAMMESTQYKERASRKNRCVRIEYANDCHIDIVPFIQCNSEEGVGQIAVRDDNKFELTNPEAFIVWFDEQNQLAGGHLRRVIKLVKYLRDIKGTFTAKSVILTTLLASQVSAEDTDSADFKDTPTALNCLMERLAQYLDGYLLSPPSVPDPSSPGQTFDHRWPSDANVYQNFRKQIAYYSAKITAAYKETDRTKSMQLWQDIFDNDFGVDVTKMMKSSIESTFEQRAPHEQFLTDSEFGIEVPTSLSHRVKVQCLVLPKAGFPHGNLKKLRRVGTYRKLEFSIKSCSVPQPYTIYWKVRNHGTSARRAEALRGQIYNEDERIEPTLYPGQHWVECYIVKNRRVWARTRYTVRIGSRYRNRK